MKKINKKFQLKKISKKNISSFQVLVRNYWPKKNHIFSRNKKLINFYYNFKDNKKTNLIGLYNNKKLVSALGLIPNKNWDIKLKEDYFIAFLVKSKLAYDSTFTFLNYIYHKIKPNFLAVNGINLSTSGKIFQRLGKIKLFSHYYILNPNLKNKISKNLTFSKKKLYLNNSLGLKFKITNNITKLPKSKYYPKKSKIFFKKKYLENPYYDYFVMNFYSGSELAFFLICRKIYIKKFKVNILRVIDFYGTIPKKGCLVKSLTNYLIDNDIEYMDMLCYGFSKGVLENIGFLKKKNNQKIPDHFEPYTGKNAQLNFSILINKYKGSILLLKGDGDQDRQNLN